LIEEKVILGFYPSIDVSKLGYIAFRVYFNFINTDPLEEEKILNELIKENNPNFIDLSMDWQES